MSEQPGTVSSGVTGRAGTDDGDSIAVAPEHARARALRTARAVTLGLALAATVPGCQAMTNAWCDVFTETRTCCDRAIGRYWDTSTNRCVAAIPVEGPIVPPDMPRGASGEARAA